MFRYLKGLDFGLRAVSKRRFFIARLSMCAAVRLLLWVVFLITVGDFSYLYIHFLKDFSISLAG